MKPTEILIAEHRVIEQVLDCLERIAKDAQRRNLLDVDSSRAALEVLETFADDCHHGKEERVLFPKLESRGMPTEVGPMAVMLEEHDMGRTDIKGMRAAMASLAAGDRRGLFTFVDTAFRFVERLRQHIAKEEKILFPMAEAMLGDDDRADVLESFARVEHADMKDGTHEAMISIADELAARLGVASAAQRGAPVFAGCCHHAHAAPRDR